MHTQHTTDHVDHTTCEFVEVNQVIHNDLIRFSLQVHIVDNNDLQVTHDAAVCIIPCRLLGLGCTKNSCSTII
uniref:Uncharacterized protein n=1 Tax=Arundo donax TaxID=35708 RepID=A0A0A9HIV5_ARUDO